MKPNSLQEAVRQFGPELAPVMKKLAEKMDMDKAPVRKKPQGKVEKVESEKRTLL